MSFHVSTARIVWATHESVAETNQKQERSAEPVETSSALVYRSVLYSGESLHQRFMNWPTAGF